MPAKPVSEDERRLHQAVIAASDRCQSDLAESVHGTLCQTLGGASLMAKVLAAELHAGNPVEASQLDELGETLDRALDEARHIFNQLQPVAPGPDGLMTALARLARETSALVPCEFECENAILIANLEEANALYRIAEEAVKNSISHAAAKCITISLVDLGGIITLKVSDDGSGVLPQESFGEMHGGELMRLRAQAAGGEFTSDSEPGRGTRVTIKLPKKAAQDSDAVP